MDVVIMVILVFVIVSIVTRSSRTMETKIAEAQRIREQCPPHKWTYRKQPGMDHEYMICQTCGMFPGGQYTEGNDAED